VAQRAARKLWVTPEEAPEEVVQARTKKSHSF
jgi:hypothetical protein